MKSRLSVAYEMITIALGIPIVYLTLLALALAAALCLGVCGL